MTNNIRLDGKLGIGTGSGRGLGQAMALVKVGANVIATDIIDENLEQLGKEAASLSSATRPNTGTLTGITADIRQSNDCLRVIEAALASFSRLDILINNAGFLPSYAYPGQFLEGAEPAKFWNLSDDVIQDVIDNNFVAHDRMARYAAPHMIARGWGRIVNVTTRLTTMNRAGGSPYGVSKASLEMVPEIWMKDLEGTGVTVNILNPGAAGDTPGFATPEEKRVATTSGRLHMIHPNQMRAPAVWLVSDSTDGVCGRTRYHGTPHAPPPNRRPCIGGPLGFNLKPKLGGDKQEVRDYTPTTGTRTAICPQA
jgi:NAD(P)-dependent dehydrogenase (short-subunit alcohol dehydrogenase family)